MSEPQQPFLYFLLPYCSAARLCLPAAHLHHFAAAAYPLHYPAVSSFPLYLSAASDLRTEKSAALPDLCLMTSAAFPRPVVWLPPAYHLLPYSFQHPFQPQLQDSAHHFPLPLQPLHLPYACLLPDLPASVLPTAVKDPLHTHSLAFPDSHKRRSADSLLPQQQWKTEGFSFVFYHFYAYFITSVSVFPLLSQTMQCSMCKTDLLISCCHSIRSNVIF